MAMVWAIASMTTGLWSERRATQKPRKNANREAADPAVPPAAAGGAYDALAMQRISLEVDIAAPPAVVWPYVVEPEYMNRWSTAPIRSLDPGDGGGPGDVGALRRIEVRAFGRRSTFDEVIVASEPPRRMVYRVFRGLPVRKHEGIITLEPTPNGTRLRWDVMFDFYLPGLGALSRSMLQGQLRASVDAMARLIPAEAGPSITARTTLVTSRELGPLRVDAERVLGEQRALAERLQRKGDPKYWFARVYQHVTEAQLALAENGEIAHPDWVLTLIPEFHRYYAGNLEGWIDGARSAVEGPWQRAFRRMDQGGEHAPLATVEGLLLGVKAHIEEDLPRALAEVWVRHYREHEYVRFRADYLSMGGVFRGASDRLLDEMPKSFVPGYLRVLRAVLAPEIADSIMNRNYYNVPVRRFEAFERGRRYATTLARMASSVSRI